MGLAPTRQDPPPPRLGGTVGGMVLSRGPALRHVPDDRTGPDPGFLEGIGAGFRSSVDDQEIALLDRSSRANLAVLDALTELGYDPRSFYSASANDPRHMASGMGHAPSTVTLLDGEKMWEAVLAEKARGRLKDLPNSFDEYRQQALNRFGAAQRDAATAQRAGIAPALIGSAAGAMLDPVNILTLPFGGGGKTIAQNVLTGALANAGVEALQQPLLAETRAQRGGSLTLGDSALNVIAAGIGGGVLSGTGKAIELQGPRVADLARSLWSRLPEPLRARWGSPEAMPPEALAEIAEAAIGRDNMSEIERSAVQMLRREGEIDTANPFDSNGAGSALHRERLDSAIDAVLAEARPLQRMPGVRAQAMAGSSLSTPGAAGRMFESLVVQESGGRRGIAGPPTPYGRAHGLTQVLDSTGAAVARKLGIAWRPELMRGTSDEAAAYQLRIGRAYFEEGLAKHGGDLRKALMYYHGGPDQRQWGPKTRAYAEQVLARAGAPPDARAAAAGGDESALRERLWTEMQALDAEARALEAQSLSVPRETSADVPRPEEPLPAASADALLSAASMDALAARVLELERAGASVRADRMAEALGIDEAIAQRALVSAASRPGSGLRIARSGRVSRIPEAIGEPDLVRSIALAGGLRDDEGHGLIAYHGQRVVSGVGALFDKRRGRSVDEIGEALHERGFFLERPTEAEVLDMIDRALRGGERIYPLTADRDATARGRARIAAAQRFSEADLHFAEVNLLEVLDADAIDPDLVMDVAALKLQGMEPGEAAQLAIDYRLWQNAAMVHDLSDEAFDDFPSFPDDPGTARVGDAPPDGGDDGYEPFAGDARGSGADAEAGEAPQLDELERYWASESAAQGFDDPHGAGAQSVTESLDHDLRMLPPDMLVRIGDEDVPLGRLLADLDEEEAAIAAVKACLPPAKASDAE